VVHAALERTHTILVQVTTCFQTDCHVEVLHAALKRTLTVLDRVFATLVGSKAKKPVQLGESAGGALATSFGWGSTK
jgi:hypothetical protein